MVQRRVDLDHQRTLAADEVHAPDPVVATHLDLTPQTRDRRTFVQPFEAAFQAAAGGLGQTSPVVDEPGISWIPGRPRPCSSMSVLLHQPGADEAP